MSRQKDQPTSTSLFYRPWSTKRKTCRYADSCSATRADIPLKVKYNANKLSISIALLIGMKKLTKTLILILISAISSAAAANESLIVIELGHSQTINIAKNSPLRVSSSQIVRATDQHGRLRLVGRKVGQAIISHDGGSLRVEVVNRGVNDTYLIFKKLLKEMLGLSLDVRNNQVLVTGRLWRLRDWQTLAKANQVNGGDWRLKAHIDSSVQETALNWLKELTQENGANIPIITFRPYVTATFAKDSNTEHLLKNILISHGLNTETSANVLAIESTIRLHLTFAEVVNGHVSQLGLEFSDGQQLHLLPKPSKPSDLIATLRFLEGRGQAKILATPLITTRSGSEGEFLAGGEIAFKSGSYRQPQVHWKRHGLYIKFKPQLDPRQIIRLDLWTEFSAPDSSSSNDLPSLRTTRTQNSVDVIAGKSLMLTRLIQQQSGTMRTGLNGLMNLPIIGALFRSENYLQQKSQLVLFITPEIISPLQNEPAQEIE